MTRRRRVRRLSEFTSHRIGVQISVADSSIALDELVDLKMLPSWANEPAAAERYAHVDGEREDRHRGDERQPRGPRGPSSKRDRRERPDRGRDRKGGPNRRESANREHRTEHRVERNREAQRPPPKIEVKFLPRAAVTENVVTQIKENAVAYSLFQLARLFLAKPERYEVLLAASAESPLYQLSEHGAISVDREFLERSAFRLAQEDFYKIDVTESEPIKGNFTSVARDRLSGTVLGPTNHHEYQKRLRGLYEQRFSRRMNFLDYQRQIEIVSDPQLVEQWKEEARKVTTYSTLREEPPITFASAAEAQRHFREKYLPDLIRSVNEATIDGVTSRRLPDRALYRVVENEWSRENASPSRMMQELGTQFRQAGVQIFRHRRGMLFVSAIRPRPLIAEETAVSASVKSIIDTLTAQPRTNRKDLADKILANVPADESDSAKLTLAAELRWLIGEGHVIEFNDGSLDLPRVKKQQQNEAETAASDPQSPENKVKSEASGEEPATQVVASAEPAVGANASETPAEAEVGGS